LGINHIYEYCQQHWELPRRENVEMALFTQNDGVYEKIET